MSDAEDDALMARVVARDPSALQGLVERHLDSVHRYLTRLTRSTADADEMSQETFLRLWQRAGAYRPGVAKLSTWLHTIAHNMAIDAMRRRPGEAGESTAEPLDPASDPEALAIAAETRRQLDAAIGRLPVNQRAALLLCLVQGFSNREAGAVLGVSVRSLESLLARARRNLRQTLVTGDGTGTDHHGSLREQEREQTREQENDHDTA